MLKNKLKPVFPTVDVRGDIKYCYCGGGAHQTFYSRASTNFDLSLSNFLKLAVHITLMSDELANVYGVL